MYPGGSPVLAPKDFPGLFAGKAPAIANHLSQAIRFKTVTLQTREQKRVAREEAAAAGGGASSGGACVGTLPRVLYALHACVCMCADGGGTACGAQMLQMLLPMLVHTNVLRLIVLFLCGHA